MHPPRQRLLVLDFIEAVLHTQGIGFLGVQALGMTAQRAEQLRGAAVGCGHQGLRQGRRHFAADAGVGDGFEHGQATEVPGDVPGPQEAGEELFQQSEVHGVTPARGKTVVQVLPLRTTPVRQAQSAWPARRKRQARP